MCGIISTNGTQRVPCAEGAKFCMTKLFVDDYHHSKTALAVLCRWKRHCKPNKACGYGIINPTAKVLLQNFCPHQVRLAKTQGFGVAFLLSSSGSAGAELRRINPPTNSCGICGCSIISTNGTQSVLVLGAGFTLTVTTSAAKCGLKSAEWAKGN